MNHFWLNMKYEGYISAYLIPGVSSSHPHAKKPQQTFVELARYEKIMTTLKVFDFTWVNFSPTPMSLQI